MTTFIASYDLRETRPDPHEVFLEKAERRGWSVWIKGNSGLWRRLPNTTLVGSFDTKNEAVDALKATRADTEKEIGIKVTMEKWIVTERGDATFDSNDKRRE